MGNCEAIMNPDGSISNSVKASNLKNYEGSSEIKLECSSDECGEAFESGFEANSISSQRLPESIEAFSKLNFDSISQSQQQQQDKYTTSTLKVDSSNQLPEKRTINDSELIAQDLRNFESFQNQGIPFFFDEDYGTDTRQPFQRIHVFKRLSGASQFSSTSHNHKRFEEDKLVPAKSATAKRTENLDDEESDGNYEGTDEENFKSKEKLIQNLFLSSRNQEKHMKTAAATVHFEIEKGEISEEDCSDEEVDSYPSQLFTNSTKKNQQKSPQKKQQAGQQSSKPKMNLSSLHKKNANKIRSFPQYTFSGGTFQGLVIESQRQGLGKQTFRDGTIYIGDWKSDKRCGKGIQIWPDGTLYEGEWQEDFIEGLGKIEYSNRSTYVGEWKGNKFHGKGRFQHFSGSFYEGFWSQDQQHGKGIEVQLFPHYSRFEGIFENGKKLGKGRLIMDNGLSYKGDFLNNNVHGLGVYQWSNGVVYEGRWDANRMQGNGKMIWPNNIVYQGEFKNDQKSGIGFIEYEDGSKYIGEWKNDKQHGKGTFYFKRNVWSIKGEWVNGKLITIFGYSSQKNTSAMPPSNMLKSINSPRYSSDISVPDSNYKSIVKQETAKATISTKIAQKKQKIQTQEELNRSSYSQYRASLTNAI